MFLPLMNNIEGLHLITIYFVIKKNSFQFNLVNIFFSFITLNVTSQVYFLLIINITLILGPLDI